MRVIAQQWVSLDGYASGPRDEQELFEFVPDAQHSERHNVALLDEVDVVLLGRRTYESFVAVWPVVDHPMAPHVNRIPKVVASQTLTVAPWGEYAPARVVADPVGFVGENAGTALVWGSLGLMRGLFDAGVLDEIELFLAPVVLGGGAPLLDRQVALRQTGGEVWGSGTTRLRYAVTTSP